MFRGRFQHNLDAKARVAIPSKFREVLSTNFDERLIVTNFDGCLWAYPQAEWQKIESKVAELPQFKPEVKALQRVFISAATECALDKSGRILLPPTLRDYAGITRELTFVGMTKRIEIWATDKWEKAFNESQESLESFSEKLADLGL
jgi:MraZ protein